MKERPILMQAAMGQAAHEGHKTVTRRPIKFGSLLTCCDNPIRTYVPHNGKQAVFGGDDYICYIRVSYCKSCDDGGTRIFPRWLPGDKLWIKEPHFLHGKWVKNGKTKTGKQAWRFKRLNDEVMFPDDPPRIICTKKTEEGWFRRNSIFMPRWACRTEWIIKSISAERVQQITEPEAEREGFEQQWDNDCNERISPMNFFRELWHKMYADQPDLKFEANPRVWRIEKEMTEEDTA